MKNTTFRFVTFLVLLIFLYADIAMSQSIDSTQENSPIATQWLLDAVGDSGKLAVTSVYMIYCSKTKSKGSGFLLRNGVIITNEHVVTGCVASEIIGISASNTRIAFNKLTIDSNRDLAALFPTQPLIGGLTLGDDKGIQPGQLVYTWGYPLGYNGPAPLLSVGYLSGFKSYKLDPKSSKEVKHLVVNGAFNSGNSGGALFLQNTNEVVGVVVNKALPLFTPFVQSAIETFSNNSVGVGFSGTDENGNKITMSETKILAEIIKSLRDMSQVMIGEAISVAELKTFLIENHITLP